jgi:MFS family permease
MGLVEMGRGVGITFGPILGGILFDWQGNYVVAFTLAALLTFVSICFIWGPPLYSRRSPPLETCRRLFKRFGFKKVTWYR